MFVSCAELSDSLQSRSPCALLGTPWILSFEEELASGGDGSCNEGGKDGSFCWFGGGVGAWGPLLFRALALELAPLGAVDCT